MDFAKHFRRARGVYQVLGPLFALWTGGVASAWADAYAPPADYYASTVGLTGAALDQALHALIDDHTVRSYNQLRQDLAVTDRDPAFPAPAGDPFAITRILLIYSETWSGYSRSGVWDSGSTWNREHTWPDSRGVGQPDSGPDFSDLHQLRAAHPGANSARGNKYFDVVPSGVAAHFAAPLARTDAAAWEPPDVDKGWIARAMAYMATRYDGTESNTTDLVLVETPPASVSNNPPQMGRKSTLLAWNRRHPPLEWERRRNHLVDTLFQGNRNPFIDHPEFVDAIYETPLGRETRLTWRYRHFTLAELRDEAVSGDLADPDGDGRPNLLELAEGANPRLSTAALFPRWVSGAPAGRQRLEYRRLRDRALAGLGYQIEVSTDLSDWTPAPGLIEQAITVEGMVELVRVEYSLPADAPAVFARLRVTR